MRVVGTFKAFNADFAILKFLTRRRPQLWIWGLEHYTLWSITQSHSSKATKL